MRVIYYWHFNHSQFWLFTLRQTTISRREPVVLKGAEVASIRNNLNMSQPVFAAKIRANPRTYIRWESEGVSGTQAALIRLVGNHPELIQELEAM